MIYVCNILELEEHAEALRPERLVSIVAPEEQPPTPPGIAPEAHLRVACDDLVAPDPLEIAPDHRHVKQLIGFAREWTPTRPILIHCQAGISRSTAAALVTYAVHFPDSVHRAAVHLRRSASYARPNPLIIALGDELLALEGRLIAAVEFMGPPSIALHGSLANIPHPDGIDITSNEPAIERGD